MDVWVVEQRGVVICQCGSLEDAVMMVGLSEGRTFRKLRMVCQQTVNVNVITQGELPGQLGLPEGRELLEGGTVRELAGGKGAPVVV